MSQPVSLLAGKLQQFLQLSGPELVCLGSLESAPVRIRQGRELVHEGQAGHTAYVLQEGWACSFKLLPDGGRQIISFPIPGDCVGGRSVLLRTSDHSFSAYTDVVVCPVETSRMITIFNEFLRLGLAILWAISRDEAILVDHLVNIGRRTARERTAHFFLELNDRLKMVGLASSSGYPCPLNQYVLADVLGLSAIHVNRVLRELRERRLMTFQDGVVTFHDFIGLKTLAGYTNVS